MVHHAQTDDRINIGDDDTIAAISTPTGTGGIGVVRLSGSAAAAIATQLAGAIPAPRHAGYRTFSGADGAEIDRGILLYFPAPRSYTGEDVVEFQCHGGPIVLHMLLARALSLGARTAEPGEFTRRAFLNGKMDLTQAESVVDLINSSTEMAARCALRSLQGEFSREVNQLMEQLLRLRVYVEAAIDFPDEEIDFLDEQQIVESVVSLRTALRRLIAAARHGRVLREGFEVVIAGLPNAGKSSLLNQLAGLERSIVTPYAGTTRDTVDLMIDVDGLPVRMTDTAGLRTSADPVERQGIERAWNSAREADLVLYLIDVTQGLRDADHCNLTELKDHKILIVWNKIDLVARQDTVDAQLTFAQVSISAKQAIGMDDVRRCIRAAAGLATGGEGLFMARRRHLEALENALTYVEQAHFQLDERQAGELVAQDLRDAMDELGQLVGTVNADELLGEIFAHFCIGK